MHILFICSQNKWRSPTAENIFSNYPNIETRSAGTSNKAKIKVNKADLSWADMICVMEKNHLEYLRRNFADIIANKKVKILYIKDKYQYMDPQLIKILKERVEPFLNVSN